VLPQQPANTGELSERDLEGVAGGEITTKWLVSAAVAITLAPGGGAAASYITRDKGW
jgi:hypothetical protein